MSFIDKIYSLFTISTKDGNFFYPYGRLSKGYLIDNKHIRSVKRFVAISFILDTSLILTCILFIKKSIIVILPLIVFFSVLSINKFLKGKVLTIKEAFTFNQLVYDTATKWGILGSIVILSACLIMFGVSLIGIFLVKKSLFFMIASSVISIIGIILFFLSAIIAIQNRKKLIKNIKK